MSQASIHVVIPAAGVGKRMRSAVPKQYLMLGDKTVLQHTVAVFERHPAVADITLVISAGDEYWPILDVQLDTPLHVVDGGQERCDSVMNALRFLQDRVNADDWVMVHDAARPCLRDADLTRLIDTVQAQNTGGLLAVPVRDTMKRAVAGEVRVSSTVDRTDLWHALTPQMFRFSALFAAMQSALDKPHAITDEASAMELAGDTPLLVEGHGDNIKITRPEDLALAGFYLQQQD